MLSVKDLKLSFLSLFLKLSNCGYFSACSDKESSLLLTFLSSLNQGVCPTGLHVFCRLGEGLWQCYLGEYYGGYCKSMGTSPCVRPLSVYLALSQAHFQWVLISTRVVPCLIYCLWYSRTGPHGAAGRRKVSGSGTSELCLRSLKITWFSWLPQSVTSSRHWGGLQRVCVTDGLIYSNLSKSLKVHALAFICYVVNCQIAGIC